MVLPTMSTYTYKQAHAGTHVCTNAYMTHMLTHVCALHAHTCIHTQIHEYTYTHIPMHIYAYSTGLLVAREG